MSLQSDRLEFGFSLHKPCNSDLCWRFALLVSIRFLSGYIFQVPARYLLAASVMSAPAALVCAKMMYPDDEDKYHVPDEELDVKVEPDQQNEAKVEESKHQDHTKGRLAT